MSLSVQICILPIIRVCPLDHAVCTKDFLHYLLLVLVRDGCLEGILDFIAG